MSGQPGQGERRESATDVRLDGDEMAADADDGDVASRARPGEDRQHGGKEAIAEAFAELERAQQAVIMAKGALHMAKDAVLGVGNALTDAERSLEMRKSLRRAYEGVVGAMVAVSRIDSA